MFSAVANNDITFGRLSDVQQVETLWADIFIILS